MTTNTTRSRLTSMRADTAKAFAAMGGTDAPAARQLLKAWDDLIAEINAEGTR